MTTVAQVEVMIKDCTGEFVQMPDYAVFLNICDVLNANPLKVKQILKPLVKRLEKKDANTLHLALQLLEVVVKNCECSHLYVGSADVQSVIVKLATNKKLELRSQEKVLQLVSTWNETFKEHDRERYLFWKTYAATLKKGVRFPPPELDSPVFTPPEKRGGVAVSPSVALAHSAGDRHQHRVANNELPMKSHHDVLPLASSPQPIRSDAAVVDATRETVSLLRQLIRNDGDHDVAEEMYKRVRYAQSDQLPAIVARALDAPQAPVHDDDDGEPSSLVAKALALTDEIDSLLSDYRKWAKGAAGGAGGAAKPSAPPYVINASASPSQTPPHSPPYTPPRNHDLSDDDDSDPDKFADDFDQFFKQRGGAPKQPDNNLPLIDLDNL